MKIIRFFVSCLFIPAFLVGCANQQEYYSAVRTQNERIIKFQAEQRAKKEKEQQLHEEKMAKLYQSSLTAASKTKEITDDILIPILFANLETQRTLSKALSSNKEENINIQKIEKPDSFGDNVRKSTSLLLGVGQIALGITQAHGMRDVSVAGLNALANTSGKKIEVSGNGNVIESYKNGTENKVSNSDHTNISGHSATIPGEEESEEFDLNSCIANPPGGHNSKGDPLWNTNGCSCDSHSKGHC